MRRSTLSFLAASSVGLLAIAAEPGVELKPDRVPEVSMPVPSHRAEYQKILADAAAAVPTNTAVPLPAGMPKVEVFVPDWANVAEKRNGWVERWDKEMGA